MLPKKGFNKNKEMCEEFNLRTNKKTTYNYPSRISAQCFGLYKY
jgi:hypothetical protein